MLPNSSRRETLNLGYESKLVKTWRKIASAVITVIMIVLVIIYCKG